MGFASTINFMDRVCRDVLGDEGTWTSESGTETSVTGMFDRKPYEAGEGSCIADVGDTTFSCLPGDVTGIKTGETFTFNSIDYEIIGIEPPVQSDSTDWVMLQLEEQS